jgi:hypothetical protein
MQLRARSWRIFKSNKDVSASKTLEIWSLPSWVSSLFILSRTFWSDTYSKASILSQTKRSLILILLWFFVMFHNSLLIASWVSFKKHWSHGWFARHSRTIFRSQSRNLRHIGHTCLKYHQFRIARITNPAERPGVNAPVYNGFLCLFFFLLFSVKGTSYITIVILWVTTMG